MILWKLCILLFSMASNLVAITTNTSKNTPQVGFPYERPWMLISRNDTIYVYKYYIYIAGNILSQARILKTYKYTNVIDNVLFGKRCVINHIYCLFWLLHVCTLKMLLFLPKEMFCMTLFFSKALGRWHYIWVVEEWIRHLG